MSVTLATSTKMGHFERSLVAELSVPVPADAIRRCIGDAVAQFEGAPIRRYIPLLVGRVTRDQLRASRAESTPGWRSRSSSPVDRLAD